MKKSGFIIATALLTSGALAQETNSPPATNVVSEVVSTQPGESAGSGLKIDPRTDQERIEFLMRVAGAYVEEKEFMAAVSAYERILEIDPTHQQARYTLGHMYISAKRFDEAEKQLLALVEVYPDDFKLLNNLAWLYATAEDPKVRDGEKAIDLAQEAMTLAPYDHHVWSTLSEAYYVTGQYEKAMRAIEHMARVAARYGQDITKEAIDDYNAQIRKCQRAMDAQKALDEISGE